MNDRLRQRFAIGMIISAVIAGFPNYLWMLGVLPHPSEEVMVVRWLYEVLVLLIAIPLGWMS